MSHRPVCPSCSYDLTGAINCTCPECGTEFEVRVHVPATPRSSTAVRMIAAVAAALGTGFVFLEVSHGSFAFWFSLHAAILVAVCSPLIILATAGARTVAHSFRALFTASSDPTVASTAAAVFVQLAAVAFGMSVLSLMVNVAGALSNAPTPDYGDLGHYLASSLVGFIYAWLIAIPSLAAAAAVTLRTPISTSRSRRLKVIGAVATASTVSTLAASIALGFVLWVVLH